MDQTKATLQYRSIRMRTRSTLVPVSIHSKVAISTSASSLIKRTSSSSLALMVCRHSLKSPTLQNSMLEL